MEANTRGANSRPLVVACDNGSVKSKIEELLASKRSANRREVYVKSLKHYLNRFADGIGGDRPIGEVTTAEIEKWMMQFDGANSRKTWLNRINTLFSYCERKGFIQRNPCTSIDRITVDHKSPVILTVEQSRNLLAACPTICKPWLILAMFAGIRPDGELMNLQWEDINLETKTAKINFPKVRKHRRIVPLEDIAVELLKKHPIQKGPVAASHSTLRRFKRSMRKMLGLDTWPADLLRHTAASYLIAKHKDANKVATMLGNSPGILLSHYHDPVTDEACQKFWSV